MLSTRRSISFPPASSSKACARSSARRFLSLGSFSIFFSATTTAALAAWYLQGKVGGKNQYSYLNNKSGQEHVRGSLHTYLVICDMASSTNDRVEPLTAVCTKYPNVALGCTVTVPSSGKKLPAMTESKVDLPAPLGPTMATRSPLLIFQSTILRIGMGM